MRAATIIVAVVLVTLSPAVQAGDYRSRSDQYDNVGSGRSSDTPVQGMTPWSNGNSDATTYRDAATGRVTGYDNHTSTSTIQLGPDGRFDGIIVQPNRQLGRPGR